MCDQTELPYNPGDIVWVKLGPVWWPGEVQDYEKLPEEITSNLRKKPIAVVKFFQEDSFEYVKNINHIYNYNCRKKHEFIKKGLDMCRSTNTRDIPSNMHLFPNDIATAEHLTGGNPNIIKDEEFAPEEKPDYSELFGAKKTPGKKLKADSIKKEYSGWRIKHLKESSLKNSRQSLTSTIPRTITHPRFINKAYRGQSDHEIRIRHQVTTPLREDDPVSSSPQKQYNCHICGFTSTRLNVIILHNKSHSAGFADSYLATSANQLKSPTKMKDYSVPKSVVKSRVKSMPRRLLLGLETPKRKKERFPKETKTSEEGPVTSTPIKERMPDDKTSTKKSDSGKRKLTKDKKQNLVKRKLENEAIRETLLKDWDEDDEMQEAEIVSTKQVSEAKPDEEKQDVNNIEVPKFVGQPRLLTNKRALRLGQSLGNKEDTSKGKEITCFDFDDSDEGIRLDGTVMKFGMKIPRVLGDDKTKRKSVDLETIEQSEPKKDDSKGKKDGEMIKKDEEDKKLETAFESLLEETAVPVIPDVPKNLLPTTKLDSKQTVSDNSKSIENSTNDDLGTIACEDTSEVMFETKLNFENFCKESEETSDDAFNLIEHKHKTDELSETLVESNAICNITKVSSINVNEFESVTDIELENKTDSDNTKLLAESCTVSTALSNESDGRIDFESNIDSTLIRKQVHTEFDDMPSNDCTKLNIETSNKMDSTDVLQQSETEEFIKLTMPSNNESTSVTEGNCNEEKNYERKNELIDRYDETDKKVENISDQSLENHTKIEKLESIHKNYDKNINNETKLGLESETRDVEIENSTKLKVDLQNIVSDIYPRGETTPSFQQNTVNENVPGSSLLPEVVKSKEPPKLGFKNEIKLEVETQNINATETNKFQDIPFDINSMPVIIGEDLIPPEETKSSMLLSPSKVSTGDIMTHSPSKNVIMISGQSNSGQTEQIGGSKALQSVISVAGKDGQVITGKSMSQKPITTVKTIKIPSGSSLNKLKTVPGFSKGGSNQVLILKTTSGQSSKVAVNKSSLQKLGTQQIIQQGGGKVLILTNPQTSGQGKITTLTSQQQILSSGSKLPPGTRLITSKGTVLSTSGAQTVTLGKSTVQKAGTKGGQKYVISKGNILATTSKNMVIGKSGILTPITSTTSKGQTFITQNVVTSKGSIIIPSSSTVSKSSSIVTQAITTNKGMILTPMTSKGVISGNQKVRIVSSTSPVSGARLVMQSPQSKIVTIPQQKNQKLKIVSNTKTQPSGGTLLIQTSQGHSAILTSTITSNQISTKPKLIPVSKALPSITPQIVPRLAVPQTQSQILTKKVGVQKVRQASPNILQKSQKKPTPRGQKSYPNRLISSQTISPPVQETILLQPTSLPVVEQSNIMKAGIPQGDATALVYLTVDESGNYRPLTDNSLVSFEGTQQESRTLYIDPSTTDMDNIFLTIDDSGNVVNISQPAPSTLTSESALPSQDILAKALANTQVLQPETIIPDTVTPSIASSLDHTSTGLNSSFAEQAQFHQPSLSHSVLETSLTLNQPIMTPLEVPSAVPSSNLSQITSLSSSFIHSNLVTNPKTQLIRPSMPLLTEDSDSSQQPEPVYLLDSAHNIIAPVSSGSQLSLQLVSQGPPAYQVVTSNVLTSSGFTDHNTTFKTENDTSSINGTNSVQASFIIQTDQNDIAISSEYNQENPSESPQITTDFLNDVELKQNESVTVETDNLMATKPETTDNYLNNEIDKPLRKRSIEGNCDIKSESESSPKRVKIEQR